MINNYSDENTKLKFGLTIYLGFESLWSRCRTVNISNNQYYHQRSVDISAVRAQYGPSFFQLTTVYGPDYGPWTMDLYVKWDHFIRNFIALCYTQKNMII